MEGKEKKEEELLGSITKKELGDLCLCLKYKDFNIEAIFSIVKSLDKAFKEDSQMIRLFHPEKYKESFGKPIKRFLGFTKADPKNPLEKTRKVLTGEETIPEKVIGHESGAVVCQSYTVSTFKTTLCILPGDFTKEGESGAFKKLLTVLLDGAKKILATSQNEGAEEKKETEKEKELFNALKVVFKMKDRREGVDSPTLFNALVNYISTNQREVAQLGPTGCCCSR